MESIAVNIAICENDYGFVIDSRVCATINGNQMKIRLVAKLVVTYVFTYTIPNVINLRTIYLPHTMTTEISVIIEIRN